MTTVGSKSTCSPLLVGGCCCCITDADAGGGAGFTGGALVGVASSKMLRRPRADFVKSSLRSSSN